MDCKLHSASSFPGSMPGDRIGGMSRACQRGVQQIKHMNFFLNSGIFGLLIVVVFIVLMVTWVVILVTARSRRAMVLFGLLAFLPLLLGLVGTCLGRMHVNAYAREWGSTIVEHEQSVVAVGRRETWAPTWLGSGATVILLLAAGCGMVLTEGERRDTSL